jgi:hypothetical protein
MKTIKIRETILLVFFFTLPFFYSCQKEVSDSIPRKNAEKAVGHKDFELKESWFNHSGLKSIIGNSSIYNQFGTGYNELEECEKVSIFEPNRSIEPIVNTAENEKTDFLYVTSSDYREIDEKVTKTVSASLGVNYGAVKFNSNLTTTTSNRITNTVNSVYINVVYVKRFGRAALQYTSPLTNSYLTYQTGLYDGTSDKIGMSANKFRDVYGDKFKSGLTFGVAVNATIQITNVDFKSESKDEVAAQAQFAVKNMVDGKTSWDVEKSHNEHFAKSELIISGFSVPRSRYIYSKEDLVREIADAEEAYTKKDLGILMTEYEPYSNLYQKFNFISVSAAKESLKKWNAALYKLEGLKNLAGGYLSSKINDEIENCNINIEKCKANQPVLEPQSYKQLEQEIYNAKSTTYFRTADAPSMLKNAGEVYHPNGKYIYGRVVDINYDPNILKPIYLSKLKILNHSLQFLFDKPYMKDNVIIYYIFREQIYPELVPIYIADNQGLLDYSLSTNPKDIRNGYGNVRLLGWVFPK